MTPEVGYHSPSERHPSQSSTPTLADQAKANDGLDAELRLDRFLKKKLSPSYYRILHDVVLPDASGHGFTQIDHIVISKWCVFVIETKDWGGLVLGKDHQPFWTVCYPDKSRASFQNPLKQNQIHIKALARCLNRQLSDFRSIVAFTSRSRLKFRHREGIMLLGHVPGFIQWRSVGEFVSPDLFNTVEKCILSSEMSIPAHVRARFAMRRNEWRPGR
jgi:hypothetical protein